MKAMIDDEYSNAEGDGITVADHNVEEDMSFCGR